MQSEHRVLMPKLFVAFLSILLCLHTTLAANKTPSLTVNIISHSLTNGAGKEVDVSIITQELEKLGHHVNHCDYDIVHQVIPADINIFLAQFKPEWASAAKLNWFIPNPEVCDLSKETLQKFDLILCKTKETVKIFKSLCKEVYYLGFTSIDHYQPQFNKDFKRYVHIAGKSPTKGTSAILNIWQRHPSLPSLVVIKHSAARYPQLHHHFKVITKRIPMDSLLELQNKSGVHLCPSRAEGFGHYIMEGMSTEAVVVTVDGPPMNEFIKDKRCLVKYSFTQPKRYATAYYVDEEDLYRKIKALQKLSKEELQKIGQQNRQEYLRRTENFKRNFEDLMNRTMSELYSQVNFS